MTLDNIIVLVYLLSILIVGTYYRSRLISFTDYATVQGKTSNSKLLLVATIFASSVGGGATFGIAEKAFSGDLSYSYGLILTLPIDILIAIYLVPQITKHYGAESVGDIMVKYYSISGRFIAGTASVRTPSQSEGLDGYEQPKGLPLLIKILLIRQSLNYQVALDS